MRFGLELSPQKRVYGGFFIYAFCMGSLPPRLPDLQHALNVTEGELGLGLIGVATGTLISLTFAAPIVERIGAKRALLILLPLMALAYASASFAQGWLSLYLLLLPAGLFIGGIEILLNLEADRTEHMIGRRIMNRCHAFWSFGMVAAGLFGGLVAQLGVSPQAHLLAMVPVVAFGAGLILGRFEPAPARVSTHTDPPARFALPTLAIMILVAVTLSAVILEGAGLDWSAIYMKQEFLSSSFMAAFAVALGSFMQALGRFFADGFVERYSPTLVARILISVSGIGAVLVYFAPEPITALIGFGLMGLGTSVIFPLAMSAAAQRTDRPASTNVAALAQTAFVAFLLGPPLLGFVAQHFGIRWSFGIGIPLVLLSLILADSLGKKPLPHAVD